MADNAWHVARGYRLGGVHCGVRSSPDRRDLGMIVSDRPAAAVGVFTKNRVVAAPVRLTRQRLPTDSARGVIVCAGNANACTGKQGLHDAATMATQAANAVRVPDEAFLVCSTGIIGRPLPMDRIASGIAAVATQLGDDQSAVERFAEAILTTDTRIKVSTRRLHADGCDVRITGVAKGAAMIGPNMATMLAFVLTDAAVAPNPLQTILRRAVDRSFHCISVDGHSSTNDTVLLLANGASGGSPLAGDALAEYGSAVTDVCQDLARAIADDAEGISHLVTIDVEGMRTEQDARRVAQTVANSLLVKTAIFGADPNWGRIVSAAGNAGVAFEEEDLSLWLGDHLLYHNGTPTPFDESAGTAYLKDHREVQLRLVFRLGSARCRFWTCDLGYEYVRLNAEYTT